MDEPPKKKANVGLIVGAVILLIGAVLIIVLIVLAYQQPCVFDGTFDTAVNKLIETVQRYPNELIQLNRQQAEDIVRQIRSVKLPNTPPCSQLPQQVELFAQLCAPSGYRQLCGQNANQQPKFDPGCNGIFLELPPEGVNGTACRIIQQRPVFRA